MLSGKASGANFVAQTLGKTMGAKQDEAQRAVKPIFGVIAVETVMSTEKKASEDADSGLKFFMCFLQWFEGWLITLSLLQSRAENVSISFWEVQLLFHEQAVQSQPLPCSGDLSGAHSDN